MKRTQICTGVLSFAVALVLSGQSVLATSEFNKQWKKEYLGEGTDAEYVKTARKAGCFVCHVKGEDKKQVRNEYGMAVRQYLDAHDFGREYVKANPEEARMRIVEGFKKAGEQKSSDGRMFGEKIESNELPATNAGI